MSFYVMQPDVTYRERKKATAIRFSHTCTCRGVVNAQAGSCKQGFIRGCMGGGGLEHVTGHKYVSAKCCLDSLSQIASEAI